MIKVSVMYPNSKDLQFDTDYYQNKHLPMVVRLVGSALKRSESAPYAAMAHLLFDDVASFQEAFGPHAATFAADVENYSNVQAELQISELITF